MIMLREYYDRCFGSPGLTAKVLQHYGLPIDERSLDPSLMIRISVPDNLGSAVGVDRGIGL